MQKRILVNIQSIIILLGIGFSFYFLATAKQVNMVPNKYMLILIGIMLILNCVAIISLLKKHLWTKIISIIAYLFILFISILGSIIGEDIKKFLDEGFNNNNIEVTTYHVLVLNDSPYVKIWDLNGKKIGYFSKDPQTEEYLNFLKMLMPEKLMGDDDLYNLYTHLIDKEYDSIILDETYLEIITEDFPEIKETVKTINTFHIEKKVEKTYEKVEKLKPINIYLSGSDSTSNIIAAKSRSDVNMIITINPNTKKVLLTSIPRDYYVQLHGTTGLKDKLTHSGIYGVDMGRMTLEDLFHIKIDYSIKVGFQSVVQLVDLVGGIDIESDQQFKSSHMSNWIVKKGINHMSGSQALAYSRERYAYRSGDRHRIQNQQQVLEAVIQKLISDKSLLLKYQKVMDSLKNFYRTDIPKELIQMLVKQQLDTMSEWTILTQSVSGRDGREQTYTGAGPKRYVMIPSEKDVENATKNINKILEEKSK